MPQPDEGPNYHVFDLPQSAVERNNILLHDTAKVILFILSEMNENEKYSKLLKYADRRLILCAFRFQIRTCLKSHGIYDIDWSVQ